ncbi:hypothetical protein Hanom_Chr16g01444531 [Helianthus anomalus]
MAISSLARSFPGQSLVPAPNGRKVPGCDWRKMVAHIVTWPEDSWPAFRYMTRVSMISSSSSFFPFSSSVSRRASSMSLLDIPWFSSRFFLRSLTDACKMMTSFFRAYNL